MSRLHDGHRENDTTTCTGRATIQPAAEEWSYPEMQDDFDQGRNVWREVSADFWDTALNVLPPMDWTQLGFLVMEPLTHDRRGAVHAMFVQIDDRHFAKYVHRQDMKQARAEFNAAFCAEAKATT